MGMKKRREIQKIRLNKAFTKKLLAAGKMKFVPIAGRYYPMRRLKYK